MMDLADLTTAVVATDDGSGFARVDYTCESQITRSWVDPNPTTRGSKKCRSGPKDSLSNSKAANRLAYEGAKRLEENFMKYLCFVFYDENKRNALSEQESQALMEEALDYDDVLRKGGHFIVAHPLESVQAASTIRVRNGKVTITDGPFAETNEQIGGFVMIEARDLNEAIQLASKIPPARLGGIEVRPIIEITRDDVKRPWSSYAMKSVSPKPEA
jgi:hypothetical protein